MGLPPLPEWAREAPGDTSLAIRSHQPCRDTNRFPESSLWGDRMERAARQGLACFVYWAVIPVLRLSGRWCGPLEGEWASCQSLALVFSGSV